MLRRSRSLPLAAALCAAAVTLAATPLAHAGGGDLTTESVGGSFAEPLFVTHAPSDAERLFVVERSGRIKIIKNGVTLATPFLNIISLVSTTFEGGLLGLAFHPDYQTNDKFYVHYTAPGLTTVVAEYKRTANPDVADTTERRLFTVPQPADNHNGGWIGFSPIDGYLYIALGDGGFSGSGPSRAQDITGQFLGKLLRIDVDGNDSANGEYGIPADNPYVGTAGDDEIWARGMRNPFRCSFDRATGDLWIGDVGEGSWEEIDFQPASSTGGENYGWGCMEGLHCSGSFCMCNAPSLTLPIHEYSHGSGCSVTGGAVYRGCDIPDLVGTYFFGDYCSGRIWSFRYDGTSVTEFQDRTSEIGSQGGLVAIGEDHDGEIYFVLLGGGVRKLVVEAGPGDVDGDGVVNFIDLLAVLAAWGPCPPPCPEDLFPDGDVDLLDLLEVLSNWT